MSGKGSGRRPQAEDEEIVQANWARIFGGKSEDTSNKDEHDDGKAADLPDPRGV